MGFDILSLWKQFQKIIISEKVKLLEEDMKSMEQRHINEMTMMKENQAPLEAKLIMMKWVICRHFFFREATMLLASNRIINEHVIFLNKNLNIFLN